MTRREHRGTPAQSAWADMEAGTHVCPQRASGSEETQVRRAWEPDAGTAGGSGVQPASRSSGVRPPCLVPRQGQHPRGGGAAPTAGSRRGLTEVLQPPPPGRAGPGRAGHRLPPSSSTPPACPISPPLPVPAARLGEGGGTHPGSCCPAGLPTLWPLRLRLPGSAWGFPCVLRPGDSPRTDASASPSICRACGFQVPFPGGNPAPGRGFRFALAAGGLGAPGRGSAAAARRSPRACPLASEPGLGPAVRVCPIAVAPGGVVWNTVGTPAEPRAPSPPVPDAAPGRAPRRRLSRSPRPVSPRPSLHSPSEHWVQVGVPRSRPTQRRTQTRTPLTARCPGHRRWRLRCWGSCSLSCKPQGGGAPPSHAPRGRHRPPRWVSTQLKRGWQQGAGGRPASPWLQPLGSCPLRFFKS